MNHNVSLSGVILPPPWLNFDGKPRQFGKNREVHFAENPPRMCKERGYERDITSVS